MFTILATNYAPVDPLTPPCDISLIPIGYKGENKARCVVFDLTDCVEQFGDGNFEISFLRQGDTQPYIVTDTDQLDYTAIWVVNSTDTAIEGYGIVQLQYIVGETVCKTAMYRTVTFDSNESAGDVPDPYTNLLDQIAAYAAEAQASARSAAQSAENASGEADRIIENTAEVVGDWLDENIGEISGYVIDKSLTVEDAAADAEVTGTWVRGAYITDKASGSIASFSDGADDIPVKDLSVGIVPVQSGTGDPAPDNIRPITGWTQAKVTRTGANLCDEVFELGGLTWAAGAEASANDRIRTANYCRIKGGVTYRIRTSDSGTSVFFYDENKTFISYSGASNTTFTAPSNACYFKIMWMNTTTYDYSLSVNYPSTDTAYHPYAGGNTYAITFPDAAGTVYGGTLDVTTGALTVTRESVNLGTLSWSKDTTTRQADGATIHAFYATLSSAKVVGNSTIANLLSSQFTADTVNVVDYGGGYEIKDNIVGGTDNNHRVWIYGSAYNSMTTTEFKNAMSNVQLCYELATPQTYTLTAVGIASLLGSNNIWADCGNSDVTYRADPKLYIQMLTVPDSDMVADANIVSGSYFMVNNNLYLATQNIANGAAIVVGTNCTLTNLAAALNAINS